MSIHEEVKYSCNQCDYKASYQCYLKKHKMSVHEQCGLFCLLGRDQKIEMKLGCENIMSQNTIVQRIGLIESLTF